MRRSDSGFLRIVAGLVMSTFLLAGAKTLDRPTGTSSPATTESGVVAVERIVEQMVARNDERARDLKGFAGKRTYRLEYKGFPGSQKAEMEVEVRFSAPASKEFKIVSQSGSGMLLNKVLKKLLESEGEAANEKSRERNALSPANYRFTFDHVEQNSGRVQYVLNVEPLREDKFLYRGRIWVDKEDFAVTRIEAEPAKNPSFWIKKTEITHHYAKMGDFWLPVQNQSKSNTRFGGHATLEIEYTDYRLDPPMQK